MISTWEEIYSRYDAIKDHKPRATKKLNELGEILASAYRLNPHRADEMWQYLIELNIKDNITFAKFYIAQVFNKLTEQLSFEEATDYVSMRPERVRLMLIYGYDGVSLNHVVYTIIGSQVINERFDEAIGALFMLEEKFTTQESLNVYSQYSVINTLCEQLENKKDPINNEFRFDIPKETILAFYQACCLEINDENIQAILQARISLLTGEPIKDENSVERILHYLFEATVHNRYGLNELFIDFLYFEREVINDEVENYVYNYCLETADAILNELFALAYYGIGERSNWYRGIISSSERIIYEAFRKVPCYIFPKNILQKHMFDSNWNAFLQLLVIGLNQETEYGATSYLDFIKEEVLDYLSIKDKKIEYKNDICWVINEQNNPVSTAELESQNGSLTTHISSLDRRYIIKPRVTAENVKDFIKVLARACILTSGSPINGRLVDEVSSFVTKETGNVDALKELGIETDIDERTELEKFCDFVEKESIQRFPYDNSYNQQLEMQIQRHISNIRQEMGLDRLEIGKVLAKKEQILSFLFLHDAHSSSIKKDIILGSLLDNNYPAALKCTEYMINTAAYPNFSDRNSWSVEMKNTLSLILYEVIQQNTDKYRESFPMSVTSAVVQIAEECLPYLDGDEANEVKAELVILKPTDEAIDGFVRQLMQTVDNYTAGRKSGYSKYVNIITRGIENLSILNRMDVIAQIVHKITDSRLIIAGPSYQYWINHLRITDEQRIALYYLVPDVYATYIDDSDRNTAMELLRFFGRLGDQTVYRAIKNQVLQKHGYIDGMSSCFRYSKETPSPIVLCSNNIFEASFLYWNVNDFGADIRVDVNLLIQNKSRTYISLFATDISINGISLSKFGKLDNVDVLNRTCINNYLEGNKINTESLYLRWKKTDDYSFKEISEISFSIIAQNTGKDALTVGPFTITHNQIDDTFALKT